MPVPFCSYWHVETANHLLCSSNAFPVCLGLVMSCYDRNCFFFFTKLVTSFGLHFLNCTLARYSPWLVLKTSVIAGVTAFSHNLSPKLQVFKVCRFSIHVFWNYLNIKFRNIEKTATQIKRTNAVNDHPFTNARVSL